MRKFILIAEAFEGSAELYYDHDLLACIDLRETTMDERGRSWLFRNVPIFQDGLKAFAGKLKNGNITESAIEVSLEDFMREYPYKRNSHLLPPLWKKMSTAEQVRAYLSAREYRKFCDRESRWYKPKIAAAWLRAKEYLNDWRKM